MLVSSPASTGSTNIPKVPLNSPVNENGIDSNGNGQHQQRQQEFNDYYSSWFGSFSGCLPTFNLFWRTNNVSTDSDNDEYEISLESIQVNFKNDYIGGGNQSSVFKGNLNGKTVAIKKLNRASEVDIKMLTSLSHANVIRTIGVSTKDICPCIIMEYCEQGGLYDVLQKRKVTKSLFCKWSREIAEGMTYLHSKKIIHRDLKSPNILVDKDDNTKICDFGSLYKYDKTFMPSVVMSFVGTSQYMPPEMVKNEPCNEKVDVWGFGVVLWELMTQEIPYKGISSMAIMYGVGSGNLQLCVPKQSPQTAKLLFRLCWSKKPRNRPSFQSICSHLLNLQAEVAELSEDAWQMRKQVWKKEINEENNKIQNGNCIDEKEQKNIDINDLNRKRINQLKHAQDLREIYEKKVTRVDKMMRKMLIFLEEIKIREEEINKKEKQLIKESSIRKSTTPTCKVTKQSYIRAGNRIINGKIDTNNDYECRSSNNAVISMQIDDDDDADSELDDINTDRTTDDDISDDDDEYYKPICRNISNRHSVGHSAITTSSTVSPKNNRNSIAAFPTSSSATSATSTTSKDVCPSCLYQFQRNSVARISGISADSGVCTTSTLTLDDNNITGQRLNNYNNDNLTSSPLYRNVEGRWSDGKIYSRKKYKRQNSRDSPFKNNKKCPSLPRNKNLSQMRSMSMIESVEVEVTEDDNGHLILVDSPMKTSPSYNEAINSSYNNNQTPKHNRINQIKSEFNDINKDDQQQQQCTSTNTIMIDSTSTMVSSLERSLEMAVGASDGLSDKESKLKAVKTHFKTHRRTASNPVPIVTETSTESDNDPVYC